MSAPLFRKDRAEPFPIKFVCAKPGALEGHYGLTRLDGTSVVIRRCACLRGVHVANLADPRNGADALALGPGDYLDPSDSAPPAPARADASSVRTSAVARASMIERSREAWSAPARRDTAPVLPGRVDAAPARTAPHFDKQSTLFTRHLRTRPGAPVRSAAQARAEMIERAYDAGRDPLPEVEKTMNGKRVDWP